MLSNKTTGYGIKYLPKHSPLPQSSNCARPATSQLINRKRVTPEHSHLKTTNRKNPRKEILNDVVALG
ncbi:uncharacterized protein FFMR_09956 [Fusarium fujikuroi]|nr:uncharacterized protein FFM5_03969 [Fusarium fujikuroi]SCO35295.1 uncharacterized protein FFNC_04341 [Fusarium fujikuroi]SCO49976.1 uncharacterized protein FFMR_09956 [Fusarium fujikuroi]SCV36624.1 uncharacterized protein FFFS_05299 [Fusarium fujikuroi]